MTCRTSSITDGINNQVKLDLVNRIINYIKSSNLNLNNRTSRNMYFKHKITYHFQQQNL